MGALAGARLAPHLLPGGDDSPVHAARRRSAGAAVGAVVLETAGSIVGGTIRRALSVPPLRLLDSFGGLVRRRRDGARGRLGARRGGAPLPRPDGAARGGAALGRPQPLNDVVPPARLMEAIERVDPFPTDRRSARPGRCRPTRPCSHGPACGRAAPSVVRVLGSACGLAVSGSGWVARPELVVTAAHVVAGQRDTVVAAAGGRALPARAVAFDPSNDVAVLRVPGLLARPLPLASPSRGRDGRHPRLPRRRRRSRPAPDGSAGRRRVLSEDAYGEGPVLRTITTLRGRVRHGNSGGPAVNASGRVEATVFAARVGSEGAATASRRASSATRSTASARPVSTGDCAP